MIRGDMRQHMNAESVSAQFLRWLNLTVDALYSYEYDTWRYAPTYECRECECAILEAAESDCRRLHLASAAEQDPSAKTG